MVERLEATLAAIGRLERFRGHLYNWYDTTDLAPLEPRYVSTVDSGNLAAHLIVLKQACLERVGDAGPDGPRPRRNRRHARARARRDGGARPRQLRSRRHVAAARGGARRGPRAARSGAGDGGRVGVAAGGARGLRGDAGGHRAGARAATARSRRARPSAWALALPRRDREPRARRPRRRANRCSRPSRSRRRLAALAREADRLVAEMDFTFLYDAAAEALLDRLPPAGGNARLRPLRPARLGGAPGELRRDRARRRARRALVPPRPAPDSRRPRLGAALLVRLDVRVPDARPRARRAVGQPARAAPTASSCGRQIRYGQERGVPWGISESAYNARDVNFTYQYSNFGVSGLGLKRGLSEDLVVAPVRDGAGRDGRPGRRARELPAARVAGRARPLRLLRVDRLHGVAAARGRDARGRQGLHGPPPGHDDRRRSRTSCSTRRCGAASTPSRPSRRRSCCCRSARRRR